ncbi:uncharacterized protein LOC125681046 isoform X1 [Ostrea edulis]|uniref:uncharacterized protein LOC125681046 isoform X1 n=1 Tax=Ostrea edulis TaxID=37623 RepID=UPI0024AF3BC3|nr:uncharacterized protein LOC125681046 isoform X1 [Ostrea edulis]
MGLIKISCLWYLVMIFKSTFIVSVITSTSAISSVATATPQVTYSTLIVLPPMQKEVAGVRMYFREGPSLSSAPVFNVYLGDRFYMFLKYTGDEYVIKPVACTAYSGVVLDESVSKVVLWNQSCAGRTDVMENFINKTSTLLQATLYGFHFNSSHYVTIECTVRICRQNTTCATSKICGAKRRRRKKDLSSLGSSSFRVLDGVTNNGGQTRPPFPFHNFNLCSILVLTAFVNKFVL